MHSRTDVIARKHSRDRVRSKLVKLSCFSGLCWLVVHKGAIRNELSCEFRSTEFAPSTGFLMVGFYIE